MYTKVDLFKAKGKSKFKLIEYTSGTEVKVKKTEIMTEYDKKTLISTILRN